MIGYLHLSNGLRIKGKLIGLPKPTRGELVFTTGMVGYTQSLTDPSFLGQILTFTYPLMGNYGVPDLPEDQPGPEFESKKIHPAAVIVSHHSEKAFHWRCKRTLDQWLYQQEIPGLAEVDTRELAQMIRDSSNLIGILTPEERLSISSQNSLRYQDDLVLPQVSTSTRKILGQGPFQRTRIAVVDCGVKWNIVRHLLKMECEVELLPWDTDLSTVDCDGWLISNGPGNPANTGNLVHQARTLFAQDKPILGICLGFQIMGLAAGALSKKLEFGHRGLNQPVREVGTSRGFITSQNHGFTILENSLPGDWEPWFRHLNDHTLEGIKHISKPFRGVQFHPEASAGPQDTSWIIQDFVQTCRDKWGSV